MENDDQQVGRILSRREMLRLTGATAVALLVGCAQPSGQSGSGEPTSAATQAPGVATQAPTEAAGVTTAACVVRPELTEGPYFVDERLNRSDIRSDPATGAVKEGVPLTLVFHVSRMEGSDATLCMPLSGVQVDVWHCDALGVYSDVTDPGFNTAGQKFLRGYQVTDANGTARFTTIYPGWYQGRAVHIHFKLRTDPDSETGYEFTSQLFFDESITDQVHAQAPYAQKGYRTLKNEGDGIFQQSGGQLMLPLTQEGEGYVGTFDIALQMT